MHSIHHRAVARNFSDDRTINPHSLDLHRTPTPHPTTPAGIYLVRHHHVAPSIADVTANLAGLGPKAEAH